jgi:hypothetical protein
LCGTFFKLSVHCFQCSSVEKKSERKCCVGIPEAEAEATNTGSEDDPSNAAELPSLTCPVCRQPFSQPHQLEHHMQLSHHHHHQVGGTTAALASKNTAAAVVTSKRATTTQSQDDSPAACERPPATEASQGLVSSNRPRVPVAEDVEAGDAADDDPLEIAPGELEEEEDDAAHPAKRRRHVDTKTTTAATTLLHNDWIRPLAVVNKPSGAAMAGLIVPSINKVVGGEKEEGSGKKEEQQEQEPIKNLLEDLSNHEKQILKQLFISNKLGKSGGGGPFFSLKMTR